MKAIFRMKLNKYQNKTILKLGNISNRFLMRQRILLSDRFLCEATGITIWLLMWILYVCTEERNKRLCFESVPLSTISSRLTHHPPPTYNAGNGRHKRAYPAESKEAQRAGYNSGDILFNSSLSVLQ